ncbi:MAG: hypothetical protein WCF65_01690 [Parachlamydiaceae bacterium]
MYITPVGPAGPADQTSPPIVTEEDEDQELKEFDPEEIFDNSLPSAPKKLVRNQVSSTQRGKGGGASNLKGLNLSGLITRLFGRLFRKNANGEENKRMENEPEESPLRDEETSLQPSGNAAAGTSGPVEQTVLADYDLFSSEELPDLNGFSKATDDEIKDSREGARQELAKEAAIMQRDLLKKQDEVSGNNISAQEEQTRSNDIQSKYMAMKAEALFDELTKICKDPDLRNQVFSSQLLNDVHRSSHKIIRTNPHNAENEVLSEFKSSGETNWDPQKKIKFKQALQTIFPNPVVAVKIAAYLQQGAYFYETREIQQKFDVVPKTKGKFTFVVTDINEATARIDCYIRFTTQIMGGYTGASIPLFDMPFSAVLIVNKATGDVQKQYDKKNYQYNPLGVACYLNDLNTNNNLPSRAMVVEAHNKTRETLQQNLEFLKKTRDDVADYLSKKSNGPPSTEDVKDSVEYYVLRNFGDNVLKIDAKAGTMTIEIPEKEKKAVEAIQQSLSGKSKIHLFGKYLTITSCEPTSTGTKVVIKSKGEDEFQPPIKPYLQFLNTSYTDVTDYLSKCSDVPPQNDPKSVITYYACKNLIAQKLEVIDEVSEMTFKIPDKDTEYVQTLMDCYHSNKVMPIMGKYMTVKSLEHTPDGAKVVIQTYSRKPWFVGIRKLFGRNSCTMAMDKILKAASPLAVAPADMSFGTRVVTWIRNLFSRSCSGNNPVIPLNHLAKMVNSRETDAARTNELRDRMEKARTSAENPFIDGAAAPSLREQLPKSHWTLKPLHGNPLKFAAGKPIEGFHHDKHAIVDEFSEQWKKIFPDLESQREEIRQKTKERAIQLSAIFMPETNGANDRVPELPGSISELPAVYLQLPQQGGGLRELVVEDTGSSLLVDETVTSSHELKVDDTTAAAKITAYTKVDQRFYVCNKDIDNPNLVTQDKMKSMTQWNSLGVSLLISSLEEKKEKIPVELEKLRKWATEDLAPKLAFIGAQTAQDVVDFLSKHTSAANVNDGEEVKYLLYRSLANGGNALKHMRKGIYHVTVSSENEALVTRISQEDRKISQENQMTPKEMEARARKMKARAIKMEDGAREMEATVRKREATARGLELTPEERDAFDKECEAIIEKVRPDRIENENISEKLTDAGYSKAPTPLRTPNGTMQLYLIKNSDI